MRGIEIGTAQEGQRLDKYLMKYLNEAPKGFIYKMLRKKNIKLNGTKATGNEILSDGDRLEIFLSDDTVDKFTSEKSVNLSAGGLDILYEDENIIAVNKDAGILTHAASPTDNDTMTHRLFKYLYEKDEVLISRESVFTPAFCNRLDRNTSGIIIGGKTQDALRQLSLAIREKKIRRFYQAIVSGEIYDGDRLEGFYRKDNVSNTAYILENAQTGDEKDVALTYKPVITKNGHTLLEIELLTGRSHQIRAQLSYMGNPILGDLKYGNTYNKFGLKRPMLHCSALVIDGVTDRLMYLNKKDITARKPDDFLRCEKKVFNP
ncbi:MAG: RluA family pseudouridine synthase [Clostridiales bacterium]|jgi:23S rRNA pseudouridine955/2504/2580 synthase|nr:RluA family pseudouridine synthase [Clostridiales bacterium]